MTKIPVDWNDAKFIWKGSEDFIWDDAYRIVQNVIGAAGDWYTPKRWEDVKKKLTPELEEQFLEVVVKVNGLTQTYRKQKHEKPKITIDHIQKTLNKFGYEDKILVKAEIIK